MELLTPELRERLLENGRQYACNPSFDPQPVVKLFNAGGSGTWLITDLDLEDEDIASGLADLGMGCPELGSVRISELAAIRNRIGLGVERDLYFRPDKTIAEYAELARRRRYIAA